MTRVLVCGGRDYLDKEEAFRVLDALDMQRGISCIIHGAARGADTLADNWAFKRSVETEAYPADWTKHGKSAGPIRNQEMLAASAPDVVLAFPGGRGTSHMVSIAKAKGVEVLLAAECPR